ncbi:MAG: acyl-CoA dehydrogenase family protein [Nocardioides sp.]|uniref:acyl-CoA dehydrogenase family protein n=1 Tax=Nocardioides sp. TaxID=35761 RepID=UPI003F0BA91D
MKFVPTAEQADFARTLDAVLSATDVVSATRAWAEGDTAAGLDLWGKLAEQGVPALLVPEDADGMGATPVELVIAMVALGRHAVPGPWVESAAYLPRALGDTAALGAIAEGTPATVAVAPQVPYALDGEVAEQVYAVVDGVLRSATATSSVTSVDAARRLATVEAGDAVASADLDRAFDTAVLATAAQVYGAGERLLEEAVAYVKQRRQFGREIGSYQAIKHQLADVRIALDFVRPLLDGAALADGTATFSRDVSAAKVAANEAAYLASRVALQVHGAIGYTAELDLSLWILKVRALVGAWGTTTFHRARVLEALVAGEGAA